MDLGFSVGGLWTSAHMKPTGISQNSYKQPKISPKVAISCRGWVHQRQGKMEGKFALYLGHFGLKFWGHFGPKLGALGLKLRALLGQMGRPAVSVPACQTNMRHQELSFIHPAFVVTRWIHKSTETHIPWSVTIYNPIIIDRIRVSQPEHFFWAAHLAFWSELTLGPTR